MHGSYLKAGDFCYVLLDCPPDHNFAPRWRGPFIIKEAINDHIYRVTLQPGQNKIINISKLKHYEIDKFSVVPGADSSILNSTAESKSPLTLPSSKPAPAENREYDDDDQSVTLPYDTRDTHVTRKPPAPVPTPPSPVLHHESPPILRTPSSAIDDGSPEIYHSLSAENLSTCPLRKFWSFA